MDLKILPDHQSVIAYAAQLIIESIIANPKIVLGTATGRTMDDLYKLLSRAHTVDKIDFSAVSTFNLDEFIGLAPEDTNSYRHYMNQNLFKNTNIKIANTFLPNGIAPDLDREAQAYEAKIRTHGGIDLQILGIGENGHIGFNEPGSALDSRTRPAQIAPETVAQIAPLFGNETLVPRRAITIGIATILDAKRIVLLATGPNKTRILAQTITGPVSTTVPASALQKHPNCLIIADKAAARELQAA